MTVGGLVRWRFFTPLPVSPVRSSTLQGRPSPSAGSARARTVSRASARSGVTQRRRRGAGSPASLPPDVRVAPSSPSAASASPSRRAPPQTASVFPIPVGAWRRPLSPAR